MPDIINPNFWDFEKGAPKLISAPAFVPTCQFDREFLVFKKGPPKSWQHQKCQDFHWWLCKHQNDLFNGSFDIVYKRWPDQNAYELVFEKTDSEPKKPPVQKNLFDLQNVIKCKACGGSGEYKAKYYIDDCSFCEGEGYVTKDKYQ